MSILSPVQQNLHYGFERQKGLTKTEHALEEISCVSRESNAGPIDGNDGFYH